MNLVLAIENLKYIFYNKKNGNHYHPRKVKVGKY